MFALEKSEIDKMNCVSKLLDPTVNMSEMGGWGILHLVCGAITGQTLSGKSSVIEGLPSASIVMSNYSRKKKWDEEIAVVFSTFIKNWSNDETGQDLAKNRLKIAGGVSNKNYLTYIYYLTLAIMLNKKINLDIFEDFNQVKEWAKNNENGWEKLFYGAGLLLSIDEDFRWERYWGCITSFSENNREKVNHVFDFFKSRR